MPPFLSSDLEFSLVCLLSSLPRLWSFLFLSLCFPYRSSWHFILLACLVYLWTSMLWVIRREAIFVYFFYLSVAAVVHGETIFCVFLSVPFVILFVSYFLIYTAFYYLVHICFKNDSLVCSWTCQKLCLNVEDFFIVSPSCSAILGLILPLMILCKCSFTYTNMWYYVWDRMFKEKLLIVKNFNTGIFTKLANFVVIFSGKFLKPSPPK